MIGELIAVFLLGIFADSLGSRHIPKIVHNTILQDKTRYTESDKGRQ